jgi:hypothetical protein
MAVEQLWVTTRPHLREELEDKLQQLSYTIETFSEENQVEFLTKFWCLKDWFTEMDNTKKDESRKKLELYAEELIKKLSVSISDRDREFTGIPLQTRMLGEVFDNEVKKFCQSDESSTELPIKLGLIGLYKGFFERKYDIYKEEKCQVPATNVVAIKQRGRELKIMRQDHQLLALEVLFTEEEMALLQNNKECSLSEEELTWIGIVQVSHDGTPHFIHRTFAEYFVADCLVNRFTERNKTSERVLDFILKYIFLKEYYWVIRVFMDGFLSESRPSYEMLKQYGNRIHDLWNGPKKELHCLVHTAVHDGNANIIGFVLDSLRAAEHTDIEEKLLLAKDIRGCTAWHLALYLDNVNIIGFLLESLRAAKHTDIEEIGRAHV